MIKTVLLSICFTAISLICFTQNVDFKKSNFSDEEGLKEALKNIKEGDVLFQQSKSWLYQQASEYYMKANDFNPENSMLNFKIGICYLHSNNKAGSLKYFLKAYTLNSKIDPKIEYALAQAYQYNMEWDNAINYYKIFSDKMSKDIEIQKELNKKILECESGKKILSNEDLKIIITNLGEVINSKYNDGAQLVPQDESMIVFTSRRKGSTGGQMDIDLQEYYEDIYFSFRDGDKWTEPVQLGNTLNTSSHDATAGLSLDGKTMFLYKGLTNNGDIFISNYTGKEWTAPKALPATINTSYHETDACMSPDGQVLYFTSDRADKSFGKSDIFVSKKNDSGDWGEAENIGNIINTEFDESGIFVHPDGKTIFFVSNGHNSMGGYDIFKSVMLENGNWEYPENLGHPFNTPDDEMDIVVFGEPTSGYFGYFTTVRPDGFGGKDIYSFRFIVEDLSDKNLVVENDTTSVDASQTIYEDDPNDPSKYFANVDNNENKDGADNTADNNDKSTNTDNNNGSDNNTGDNYSGDNKSGDTTDNSTDNSTVNNADSNNDSSANNSTGNEKSASAGEEWKTQDMSNKNVVFRIQVGASHKPMPKNELRERYRGNLEVTEINHEGWYKYLIGYYTKYSDAKELQKNCGTYDAWVVTQKDGVRVHIREILDSFAFVYRIENFMYL